ncbi:MAG: hypothetical protein KGI45_00180 [Patescibacteria group bacterium]|nr:hypothetical protein [Patescibacteria group bacterium]MDE1966480.1 hypothetical protein [Patescibacteria group bacterium]
MKKTAVTLIVAGVMLVGALVYAVVAYPSSENFSAASGVSSAPTASPAPAADSGQTSSTAAAPSTATAPSTQGQSGGSSTYVIPPKPLPTSTYRGDDD